jgi:hypothetical protein
MPVEAVDRLYVPDNDPCPLLGYDGLPVQLVSSGGGFCGFQASVSSSHTRAERSGHIVYADSGYNRRAEGSPEHSHSPERHIGLGFKVLYCSLALGIAFAIGFWSLNNIARRGANALPANALKGHALVVSGALIGLAAALVASGLVVLIIRV